MWIRMRPLAYCTDSKGRVFQVPYREYKRTDRKQRVALVAPKDALPFKAKSLKGMRVLQMLPRFAYESRESRAAARKEHREVVEFITKRIRHASHPLASRFGYPIKTDIAGVAVSMVKMVKDAQEEKRDVYTALEIADEILVQISRQFDLGPDHPIHAAIKDIRAVAFGSIKVRKVQRIYMAKADSPRIRIVKSWHYAEPSAHVGPAEVKKSRKEAKARVRRMSFASRPWQRPRAHIPFFSGQSYSS